MANFGNLGDVFFAGAPANLSPAEISQHVAQRNLLNQEGQQRTFQLRQLAQAESDDKSVRDAFSANVGPDGSVNRAGTLKDLAQTNPMAGMKIQHQWTLDDAAAAKAQREARAAQLDAVAKEADELARVAGSITDQPSYERGLAWAKGKGMDVNGWPTTYDPGLVKQTAAFAISAKDRAENELQIHLAQMASEEKAKQVQGVHADANQNAFGVNSAGQAVPIKDAAGNQIKLPKPASGANTLRLVGGSGAATDDQVDAYKRGILAGTLPFPTGRDLMDPVRSTAYKQAIAEDPTFNANTHKQRAKMQEAFTKGRPAEVVNALNTAMGHLSELSDLSEKLGNGNIQMWNRVGNWASEATGDPTITAFNTTKKAVADEVTRVWRGTGGSEADIQEAMKNLDASQSPQQLRANIFQLTKLMASKQKAMEDQYNKGMGGWGDLKILNDEARESLSKIQKRAGASGAQGAAQGGGWGAVANPASEPTGFGQNPRFPKAAWSQDGASGPGWYVNAGPGKVRRVE